jgi:glycerophosphoryl diester phosphodiesterase
MKKSVLGLLYAGTLCGALCAPASAQTLEGVAKLPADTFAAGPTSGQLIAPTNGRVPPFEEKQPVQGLSSVLPGRHGDYWVMPDNGFGAKENSPDFLLRVYRIDPQFKTASGGPGTIDVKTSITPAIRIAKLRFRSLLMA